MVILDTTDSVASDPQEDDTLSIGVDSNVSGISDVAFVVEERSGGSPKRRAKEKGARAPRRHKDYYIEDEHLKLQTGDIVFRVHSYFFWRESEEARAVVKRSWVTADRLVELEDVSADDLERFCEVLYCRVSDPPRLSTKDEWTSVLRLSHMWNFSSMHTLAVRRLLTLTTPVDKIVLGRKYGIHHWLRPAYQAICEREDWLTEEEGQRLGLQEVMKIGRARQALRNLSPLKGSSKERDALIDDEFGVSAPTTNHHERHPEPNAEIPSSPLPAVYVSLTTNEEFRVPSPIETATINNSEALANPRASMTTFTSTLCGSDGATILISDQLIQAPVSTWTRERLKMVLSTIDAAEKKAPQLADEVQKAQDELTAAKAVFQRASHNYLEDRSTFDDAEEQFDEATTTVATAMAKVAEVEECLKQANADLVNLVSPGTNGQLSSYRITPDVREALITTLTQVDHAGFTYSDANAAATEARRKCEEQREFTMFWDRIHTNTPTPSTAKVIADTKHQAELTASDAIQRLKESQDAEAELAFAQQRLADLLNEVATSARSGPEPSQVEES